MTIARSLLLRIKHVQTRHISARMKTKLKYSVCRPLVAICPSSVVHEFILSNRFLLVELLGTPHVRPVYSGPERQSTEKINTKMSILKNLKNFHLNFKKSQPTTKNNHFNFE